MTEFYAFAGEHPILTFFLAMIVAEVAIKTAQAVFGIFK